MASPWEKTVTVTLISVDPLKYTIEPTGPNPLPVSNGDLVFDNDKHNGFNIKFKFVDKTNVGYLWPPNNQKDQAVWSVVGTNIPCPESPDTEVFHATGVDPTRTVLTVNNPNPKPAQGAFKYTLCVVDPAGKTLSLDPGGLNNNGPTSVAISWTAVVVGVATVAIIAVALYEFGVFR